MTSTRPTQEDQRPIHLEAALARLDHDHDLLTDLARFYLEDSVVLFAQLKEGVESGDFDLITRSAHSLKGLSANFDAHSAMQIAHIIEQSGRERQLAGIPERVIELEIAVQQVVVALKTQLLSSDCTAA